MSSMASQITSVSIVCSTLCSGADQRRYQSSASLAFVGGIHRWPLNSSHTGPVTRIFSICWLYLKYNFHSAALLIYTCADPPTSSWLLQMSWHRLFTKTSASTKLTHLSSLRWMNHTTKRLHYISAIRKLCLRPTTYHFLLLTGLFSNNNDALCFFSSLTFSRSLIWWRHQMETFSALLALIAGNSPVTGEFPSQRPVTRSFDVFFDLRLNKRLSKQSRSRWFERP